MLLQNIKGTTVQTKLAKLLRVFTNFCKSFFGLNSVKIQVKALVILTVFQIPIQINSLLLSAEALIYCENVCHSGSTLERTWNVVSPNWRAASVALNTGSLPGPSGRA